VHTARLQKRVRNETIRENGYKNKIFKLYLGRNVWYGHLQKKWMKKDDLTDLKLDNYWKKETRETKSKMERRRTQSDGRMWSTI
jgi:hypothetical protein